MDCFILNVLVVILYRSSAMWYHWSKLGKGYTGSLCIISYNCTCIYSYLNFFLISHKKFSKHLCAYMCVLL